MKKLVQLYLKLLFLAFCAVILATIGFLVYHEDGGKGLGIFFGIIAFVGSIGYATWILNRR